jgi:glycosyltransferase involved in cell wall biosynthesis
VNSERRGLFQTKLIKNYFIDLIASTVASRILVESKAQQSWYEYHFPFTRNKCFLLYTGLDESDFIPDENLLSRESRDFTVIFRGKDNDEAGLKVLAQATLILAKENIRFIVLSTPRKEIRFSSDRTQVIERYFESKSEIAQYYKKSDLSLGQLSGHSRLKRTIPHKAFEAAYLGIPYLTARNEGILEIFSEGEEVFCFEPGNPSDLAEKILYLSKNQNLLSVSAEKIKAKYERNLSQEVLGNTFLKLINS